MLRLFVRNKKGSIAIWLVFAFALVFGSVALAIDLSRVFAFKTRLERAAEAASLIAARNLHLLGDVDLVALSKEVARIRIETNPFPSLGSVAVQLRNFDLAKASDNLSVTVSVDAALPTALLHILNFEGEFEVSASATARMFTQKTELVLILDSSLTAGNSGKHANMAAAAQFLTDKLAELKTYGSDLKLAVIPHASALMNVAPHKEWLLSGLWPVNDIPPAVPGIKLWEGDLEKQRWCVGRRTSGADTSVQIPSIQKFPLILGIDKITGADGIDRFSVSTDERCAGMPVRPLSASFADLSGFFSKISPNADFASGRGFVWAERLLSPDWRGIWNTEPNIPSAFDADVQKIVLLITASGNSVNPAEELEFTASCERLRQKGVAVHIFDYGAPQNAAQVYEACVNNAGNYRKIPDANGLKYSSADFIKSLISSTITALD